MRHDPRRCSAESADANKRQVWAANGVCFLGKAAKLPFAIHPHMLRHSTGYKLANDGHDTRSLVHYLGHRNLQSTARYTALAPDRFKDFWRD
jgi:site-specific recombinase XerD